jgi:hypothetical protein
MIRTACPTVVVIITAAAVFVVVVVVVVFIVTISSHRIPVKFGKQIHAKPPIDVSVHLPPWKHGKIAHGLGGVVIRITKQKINYKLINFFLYCFLKKPRSQLVPK